jgi:hypothetical protein
MPESRESHFRPASALAADREATVGPKRHDDLLARRDPLYPVPETIPKGIRSDAYRLAIRRRRGVELRGLEPLAFALPARRSTQLSYSPDEVEVIRKGSTCLLSVASGRQAQMDLVKPSTPGLAQETCRTAGPAMRK